MLAPDPRKPRLILNPPQVEKREKSVRLLVEELERCQKLGLTMFNIHPGSSCGQISRDECVQFIAEGVNQALQQTIGVKVSTKTPGDCVTVTDSRLIRLSWRTCPAKVIPSVGTSASSVPSLIKL